MACTAASTAAAPLMSAFIVSIAFGGLSDSPPEPKVMPLPANTTVRAASGRVYSSRTSRGGWTERHRRGLLRLTRGERDGDSLGPSLRSRRGSGQIAGRGAGGAAQPLQVGLPLGARAGRRIGRAGLRAQAHGDYDRGRQLAASGNLGEFLGLARGAERGERGHQVDFIG